MQKIVIDFVNVVATTCLRKQIDLENMATKLPNAELNTSKFPGIILKIKNPRATALIFSSGALICTGTQSVLQARQTTNKVIEMLSNAGYNGSAARIRIENIVVSVNYGRQINLDKCARVLPRCMYEPEQFPAVFYRMGNPIATTLIYKTGKLVCTGLNTEKKIILAITTMERQLLEKQLFV
ncbi:TATA-box-binding protein [Candidatus Nitrosotenuis uzonensis]|uniref:TATA-box-binding protein n=1 Tax=Candidatus Nitrosotenuis uzonensis TaxID=1407055 RepID=V6ARG4_9ARCH|nr:hypothetical protein [Candidatus Nitrosotenuis uzonensis]CDI05023.1 putative TATA-box-binding protein [Candidatus Nitrosotenuis uzonensis]